jgi:hypothetical protein
LFLEFDILDALSEQNRLAPHEIDSLKVVKDQLNCIWQQEEAKAWQRSRERHILEGGRNTSYFHALANQRRMNKKLDTLNGPDGPVHDTNSMLKIAYDFYEKPFLL